MKHNFKELKVWQRAMALVQNIYVISKKLPDSEKYGLTSQITRCAVSIPSNIAEGSARGTEKEFQHFLRIALGSSFELETQLIIARNRNYITEEQLTKIEVKIQEFQKMTMSFQNKL